MILPLFQRVRGSLLQAARAVRPKTTSCSLSAAPQVASSSERLRKATAGWQASAFRPSASLPRDCFSSVL